LGEDNFVDGIYAQEPDSLDQLIWMEQDSDGSSTGLPAIAVTATRDGKIPLPRQARLQRCAPLRGRDEEVARGERQRYKRVAVRAWDGDR
jgi:hypothetical protein